MRNDPVQVNSGRRTLGTLQPSAGDHAVLVGSGGKLRVDIKKVDTKRRRLNFDLENKPPSAVGSGVIGSNLKASASPRCSPVSHQEQQHANLDVYVDVSNDSNASSTPRRNAERKNPNNTGSAVVSRDAYDLLLRDDATVDYWRMIAEQRRVALENALKENRQLHEEVEVLTAENKHLQKIADHCGELAELVKALTADDDEGDNDVNGNEEETPNETNES
ncbi:geminin-like isoform X2 [Varroa jacobsoni]|uniref:Geminin n=1 Tax=Varroa destructor TaxID=109461 RepID=A0A7M7KP22_VARDE|nr:geminin-like isoform X2 [Varroa destructor]XP_022690544.1 geminin-like isoform X2 [Varroa jacobsoni]